MRSRLRDAPVLVAGAGIMGAGIAQIAAQAGHHVYLYDVRDDAASAAKDRLATTLDGLVVKGKLTGDAARSALGNIEPVATLEAAASAGLVVEAIVEAVDAKRALFRRLEDVMDDEAVLATNTSSISVTAIANGMRHPARAVGMHFFNPVPLMKLVEVVSGIETAPAVAGAIAELARQWGKTAVHARSTPGFIVNRIARPYYAETLALLQENVTTPHALDACFRAAGFRMGPCELMDLIGHDTNFAVTQSVYEANFFDKRYVPSLVQRELVDGGLLGRKSGHGFYRYPAGAPALVSAPNDAPDRTRRVVVHGRGSVADRLADALATSSVTIAGRDLASAWVGLSVGEARLLQTDGRTASDVAGVLAKGDVAVFDRLTPSPAGSPALAYAIAESAGDGWRAQAPAWLELLGFTPVCIADAPGLVVARTTAMLINEAADAVLQSVCTREGADAAMKLGVNYPLGPFEWLDRWGADGVIALLDALDHHYRGERYRVSPWLRRERARAGSGTATPR